MSGNFVFRHLLALLKQMSPAGDFIPQVTVFHFPLYQHRSSIPAPLPSPELPLEVQSHYCLFTSVKTDRYSGIPYSNQVELELIWTPIFQYTNKLLKPINACWYWLVVVTVIVNYSRKNAWNSWVLHLHSADKIAWPLGFLKRYCWPKIPLWYTEHWAIFGNQLSDSYQNRSMFFQWYMKRIWKQTDVSAAISVYTHQQLQHTYRLPKRMYLFRNPVDTSVFNLNQSSQSMGNYNAKIHWLHISNFDERKQVPSIIRAFAEVAKQFPNSTMELSIAGGDLQELGLKNPGCDTSMAENNASINFLGKLSSEELSSLMRKSTALILFSTAENVPCVIAEAQCCGLPIITTAIAGIPEMVAPELVWFTPGGDDSDLVSTMLLFIAQNNLQNFDNRSSELRPTLLQSKVSEQSINRFDPNTIGKEILSAYQRYTP